ncbi:MAG: 3-ketoacyl-ACP reductase, partial [Clostridia bacterium]|nr:3-ketoacyl-ACP reductase [Clostridia bacterium]
SASVANETDELVTSLLDELRACAPDSMYVRTDISKDEDRKNLVKTVVDKFGKIDILVNNAGVAPTERRDILEMSEQSMDRLLNINLKGTFFLTQAVANAMVSGGFGSAIINITSMSVYTSSTNRGEYCISKAGLAMVTTLFADRLAKTPVRVYEVRPGIIETPMTAGVKGKYEALIDGGLLPIQRMGQPEDVARAVLMLASGYLGYSTGEIINVDGGFHIQRL